MTATARDMKKPEHPLQRASGVDHTYRGQDMTEIQSIPGATDTAFAKAGAENPGVTKTAGCPAREVEFLPPCGNDDPHVCALDGEHDGAHECCFCTERWDRGPWDDESTCATRSARVVIVNVRSGSTCFLDIEAPC